MEDERERNWISKRSMSTHKVIQEHKTKQNEDRVEGGMQQHQHQLRQEQPSNRQKQHGDPTSTSETYAKKPNDPRTRLTQPPPTPNR